VNSDIASLFFKRRVDTKDPTNRRNILLYVRMSEPIHPDDEEEYRSLVKGQDLTSPIPLEGQDLTTLSTTGGQSLTAGGKQSTELSRNLTGPGQELPAPQQNLTREEPRLNKLGTILNALSPSKLISKSNLQELKQPETIQTETKIQPESKTSLLSGEVLDTVSESGDELDREKSKPSSNRDIPAGSKVWNAAKSQLQLELSKAIYDTWLKDIEVIEFGNNALVLGAANDYASDWLNERTDHHRDTRQGSDGSFHGPRRCGGMTGLTHDQR
jgi:hypothetical protein